VLDGRGHILKGVTRMRLMATILVAVFVVAAGTSFVFAECAGHNKAQLVKQDQEQNSKDQLVKQDQEQNSKDQLASTEAPVPVPEKVAQSVKPDQAPEKK
jgi:hypothetical protein